MIHVGILSLKNKFPQRNQGGRSHLHSYYDTSKNRHLTKSQYREYQPILINNETFCNARKGQYPIK